MKKYARQSDANGQGMNSGYCFGNGEYYCQNDKQAEKYVESLGLDWKEELKKFNTVEEWFYYTDWKEIDTEEYFDIYGNSYTICENCKTQVKIINDNYECNYCSTND